MDMTYAHLNLDEVPGRTTADYLVHIDSDFILSDRDEVVLHEPSFPVVELAWQLRRWISAPGEPVTFEFNSMSYEEVGVVSIRRVDGAWVAGSVFAPGVSTAPSAWPEVEASVNRFISRVRADLHNAGIPPDDAMPL